MNRLGAKSKKLYILSGWIVPVMPLVIALIGWCNGLDGTEGWLKQRPVVTLVIERIQESSFWVYLICWPVFFGAAFYRKQGDPWHVEQLQFILDKYQAGAFNADKCPAIVPQDHNRVTLFRYKFGFARHWSATRWYWPWGKHRPFSNFLVPVLRSGHMSRNSKAVFYVSDDSDKTEGLSGRAWTSNKVVFEENLPKIELLTSPARQTVYARRTNTDPGMIAKRIQDQAQMPRSMMAIPVQKAGKMWGVIVLDSRYPHGVNQAAAENYQLTIALIERLLEKAS